jgi:hypothetical protein
MSNAVLSPDASLSLKLPAGGRDDDNAPGPCHRFYWSQRALRTAALTVAALALLALPTLASNSQGVRLLSVCWLVWLVAPAQTLSRRVRHRHPVLTIDALGITDQRLRPRRIFWQDIASFDRVDLERSKTIEIFLKQPNKIAAGDRLSVRLGAWLQRQLGLPAVTINLLFIDASASDIARIVAAFRPGLLPIEMLHCVSGR